MLLTVLAPYVEKRSCCSMEWHTQALSKHLRSARPLCHLWRLLVAKQEPGCAPKACAYNALLCLHAVLLPCRRAYCSYADALFPPLWMGLVATLATLQLLPLWQVSNRYSP